MGFRLFGVDVEIQIGFWITAFVLGYNWFGGGRGIQMGPMLLWMAIVLVSILVHEYGHAFAFRRHAITSSITLHWMGGHTTPQALLPLSRLDRVIISVAGPFAGFALAALAYSVQVLAEGPIRSAPPLVKAGLQILQDVNLYWGVVNLLPVVPFDGGHVLQQALGPKRVKLTAMISLLAGLGVAVYFLSVKNLLGAMLFGMAAVRSFSALRDEAPSEAQPRRDEAQEEVPSEVAALLRSARQALEDERLDRAIELAEQVLARVPGPGSGRVAAAALEVIAWAHHLSGRLEEAEAAARRAGVLGPVDAALAAALLLARGERKEARRLLELARAQGDDRKEIVGPLIQVLLEEGEVARASAVAYDVVDSLSKDDIRQMASLSFEGGAYEWAGRLWEAAFGRDHAAEDAYAAARARAKNGEPDRALELLRKAVAAGFSDRARAWSDAALSSLRADSRHLEAVLPRP
jgi:Zn-dependent protease